MADFDQQLSLPDSAAARVGAWRDYVQLAKLRLNGLVLVTTLAGYLLAGGGLADPIVLLAAIVGAALAAIGAGALNQYLERDVDRRMKRTADRPLPAGRLSGQQALAFGSACVAGGVLLLALRVKLDEDIFDRTEKEEEDGASVLDNIEVGLTLSPKLPHAEAEFGIRRRQTLSQQFRELELDG